MTRILSGLFCLVSVLHAVAQDAPEKLRIATGEVSMIDDKSLTLARKKLITKFPLEPQVKVLIQTNEFIDIGKTKSPKNAVGKLADVKVGQQVTIAYHADNKVYEIVVLRPKGKS